MKKVKLIIYIITVSLLFSCYFDTVRENANDPRSNNYQYYFYTTQWGSYGSGNGQFNSPEGIAIDSGGNVYVADTWNNRVQKFTSNGDYITYWGISLPHGIAIDSDDNVYVTGSYCVQKYSSSGTFITQWGTGGIYIAIDSGDYIYITDSYCVQKYSSSGTLLTQWGSEGSDNGQFSRAEGIAVDSDDNVYVIDSDNYRIQKFTSNGDYITQWGDKVNDSGNYFKPRGIAIDSIGNVLVIDYRHLNIYPSGTQPVLASIKLFSSSGQFITQLGSYGPGNGEFSEPMCIAEDSRGNVYVTEAGPYLDYNSYTSLYLSRVQKFHYRPRP